LGIFAGYEYVANSQIPQKSDCAWKYLFYNC
jgi:hypothetical protein